MAGAGSVSIEGLDKLLRATRKENLIDGPIREMLNDVGRIGVQRAGQASPRQSGRMSGGFEHKVAARSVTIRNRVKRTSGKRAPFPYPSRQEFGPGKNQGRVRRAVQTGPVQQAVQKAAKLIESRFVSG